MKNHNKALKLVEGTSQASTADLGVILGSGYDGFTVDDVRKMSHKELVAAVVRMLKVAPVKFDDYHPETVGFLHDDLADAFRGR